MPVTEDPLRSRFLNSALKRSVAQGLRTLRANHLIRPLTTLALLGLFTLPLGILVRQLVWEFDAQIKVLYQERMGLSYNNHLMAHLTNLLEHRSLVYQPNPSPEIAWKRQEIDRQLEHLKSQDSVYRVSLQTKEYGAKIDYDWRIVMDSMGDKNLTRYELYTLQTTIINNVYDEILRVGNVSNLILDDSLDTYYLANTLINLIPIVAEKISRARDLQSDLTNQTIDTKRSVDEVRSELIFLKTELQQLNRMLYRNRVTLLNANAELELSNNKFLVLNRRINKFSSSLLKTTTQPELLPTGLVVTSFQPEADEAIGDARGLYDTLLPITDRLLSNRLVERDHRRRNAIVFTGLSLMAIVTIYLTLARSWQLRHRAEQSLKLQYQTTQIAAEAMDLSQALPTILQIICQNQGWHLGEVWLVSDDSSVESDATLRCSNSWYDADLNKTRSKTVETWETLLQTLVINQTIGFVGHTWHQRQIQWLKFPNQVPLLWGRTGLSALLQLQSAVSLPLLQGDRCLGVIALFSKNKLKASVETDAIFTTLGRNLGEFIHRQQTAIQLITARDEAEASSRSKSQFLANMSHELRTPLNAIIGYSELLQEDAEVNGQSEMISDLSKVKNAGQHLLGLVNDILDLSKIEAGQMDLYLEHFEVRSLLTLVIPTIEPLLNKNGNYLEVNCASNISNMYADVTKVRQILLNLLSNATKFTNHGLIKFTINLVPWTVAPNSLALEFQIEDSGIGIAPDNLDKLFQSFTQADASTTREYGGTGLGLAISKQFAQMMGGHITVTSELGTGSIFTLRLPLTVQGWNLKQDADRYETSS